jgi:hypothetical protein
MHYPNILFVQFLIVLVVNHASSLEREMTIQIQAKEKECFFEKLSQCTLFFFVSNLLTFLF